MVLQYILVDGGCIGDACARREELFAKRAKVLPRFFILEFRSTHPRKVWNHDMKVESLYFIDIMC